MMFYFLGTVNLYTCFFRRTLATMVASVLIKGYFDMGFRELTVMWESKLEVAYVEATRYPHGLVVSLYRKYLVGFLIDLLVMI